MRTTLRMPVKLNIGCGPFYIDGWVNIDSDGSVKADANVDAVAYLSFLPADSVDEVYMGHVLEHMEWDEGQWLLTACRRVMKSGARIGVVVPDGREICRRYLDDKVTLREACSLYLYSTVQPSRHRWLYDLVSLRLALEESGFVVTGEIDRRGDDPRLASGAWYQCGLDGRKP